MQVKNAIKFTLSVAICEAAGIIGSAFTAPAIPVWYDALEKPFFTPPGWVIGLVWTMLYFLMGVALYLVWSRELENKTARNAIALFGIQLALNVLWSYLFFGLRNPFYGFVGIIFLWLSILATILEFKKINKVSAYLLLPYLLWVTFAAYLNFTVWMLN